MTPPELADRTFEAGDDLADLVTQIRDDAGVPAMAVAVAHADGEIEVAATGVRAFGGTDAVTTDDLFHIGSVTKSMTAVVIAERK